MSADGTIAGRDHTPRWGMVVDINRCVGCQTCTIACKHSNDTPPGVEWRRVLDVERGEFPDVERLFLVVGCQHCAEPPCVPVCPTGATRQRADGLVTMDYDTCIGCGYCAVACPYQARTIVHDKEWFYGEPTVQEEKVYHDERLGVVGKCTFCIEKIDEAAELSLTPGVDLEVTPACSASCIAQAIHFGDFADPDSNVSRLVSDNAHFQMHAELGTDPQIKYLYEVPDTTPGRDPEPNDLEDEVLSYPENSLVGQRQTFWDLRAAMNFIMGGMSSGLAVMAFPALLYGRAWGDWLFSPLGIGGLQLMYVVAGVGIAIGLFFVFMEIGRKARFMYVLRRPWSSWMTRETYAVALFYPALLADLIWPTMALHLLVAIAAGAFLYCQAWILHAGKGVPAWRVPMMPWMLIGTGVYEGLGILAIFVLVFSSTAHTAVFASVGLAILAVVNAVLWRVYVGSAKKRGIGPLARRDLASITPYLHGAGHVLPFVCAVAGPFMGSTGGWFSLLGLGGLAAVAGGALWKLTVITRACHQQGFAVPKMPQRGSGKRAAPARLQPI